MRFYYKKTRIRDVPERMKVQTSQRSYSVPRVKSYGSVLVSHRLVQPCSPSLNTHSEKFVVGESVSFVNSSGSRSTGTVVKVRAPYYSVSTDGDGNYDALSPLLTLTSQELMRVATPLEEVPKPDPLSKAFEVEVTKDLRSRRKLIKMLDGNKARKKSTTREELELQLSILDDKIASTYAALGQSSSNSAHLAESPHGKASGVWMRPRVARGDSTSLPPVASLRSVLKQLSVRDRHSQLRSSGFRYKRALAAAETSAHDLEEQVWTAMPKESSDRFSVAATFGADSPTS